MIRQISTELQKTSQRGVGGCVNISVVQQHTREASRWSLRGQHYEVFSFPPPSDLLLTAYP